MPHSVRRRRFAIGAGLGLGFLRMMMAGQDGMTAGAAPEGAGRLGVAIASTGRAAILGETVRAIAAQERLPDIVWISVPDPSDCAAEGFDALPFPVEILISPKGASAQRNRVIDRLGSNDIVLFLDDDFLMAPEYLKATEAVFAAHPDVIIATGTVIADGIGGAGFSHADGQRLLTETARPADTALEETYGGYGCNMAVRAGAALAAGVRFDERLPLYSWLEDIDFSRRLVSQGRIVRVPGMAGVHLGTKTGRQKGILLGYSQVANPIYMVQKGSISRSWAFRLMRRNVAANIVKSLRPEPWIDRRGRLRGNILALRDWMTGRLAPERILEFR